MQEERKLEEFLEMMIEKMESMQEEIKVLNEKQNKEGHNEVQKSGRTDGGKQIPFSGL